MRSPTAPARTLSGPSSDSEEPEYLPCRLVIAYEMNRIRQRWTPKTAMHRRALALRRQRALAEKLGLAAESYPS